MHTGDVSTGPAGRLVGRETTLREIDDVLNRAAAGAGRVVLLSGEAGMGKTALCEEASRRARSAGFDIAWSSCWQSSVAPPLFPIREVIDQLDGDSAALLTAAANEPEDARQMRATGLTSWLRTRSTRAPLLIVVDDLHWADAATAEVVAVLAAAVRTARVAVLVTLRPAGVGPFVAGVAAQLRRQGRDLPIDPLTTDDVRQLLADPNQPGFDPVRLRAVSGGNPLYLRELLRLLGPRGLPTDDDPPVPSSVGALVMARLRSLPAPIIDVLRDLAVLGDSASVDLLTAVRGEESGPVLDQLDLAAQTGFVAISRGETIAWTHPMHRSAVYDAMATAERVRRHAGAAVVLAALRSEGATISPTVLAHHFGRSVTTPGHADLAVTYALEAGREALSVLAHHVAVLRFEQAIATLARWPEAGDRLAVLLELGEARRSAGDLVHANAAFDEALTIAATGRRPVWFARAALARSGGDGFEIPIADAPILGVLDRAIDAVGPSDLALRARLLARRSVAASYDRSLAQRAADSGEAVELARRVGDAEALGTALAATCDVIAGPAYVEERQRLAVEIITLAQRHRLARLELLGRRFHMVALLEAGSIARAEHEIDAYERLADPLDLSVRWCAPLWRAAIAYARGDAGMHADALATLEALVASGAGGNAGLLLLVHRLACGIEVADPGARALLGEIGAGAVAVHGPQALITEALLLQLGGHGDEGAALVAANRAAIADMVMDSEWLPAMCQLAEIAVRANDPKLAGWVFDRLLPWKDRWSVEGIGAAVRGPVRRWLAMLAELTGDLSSAKVFRSEAVRACERAGAHRLVEHVVGPDSEPDGGEGPAQRHSRFRRVGESWELSYHGATVVLRDRKGLQDLAVLLATPRRAVAALDLASPGHADVVPKQAGIEVIDAQARAAYQRRLRDIEAELEEADRFADLGRSNRLVQEREAIVAELRSAYGLGGRARRSGDGPERARTAVTARVKDAIRRIEQVHPAAGQHLSRSIRTGTFCVYDPEATEVWDLT